MIHKIKAMHDNGNGLSIRSISEQLGIARNTVRKYLRMDEQSIARQHEERSRTQRLDSHRDYIVHLLGSHPGLSAVKVARKLREKFGEIEASDRSIRRYVRAVKEQAPVAQHRYYEPIIDDVPGLQCQVDPGEQRGVMVAGVERTVYFVAFVLSCSRLMYVGLVLRPLDTGALIEMHDQALRYFGGRPEEFVYDQTKLVVIHERYRELELNQRFHQFASTVGFRIHACEGYDPESKGKVESAVKYIKNDCLYGESFRDEQHLREHVQHWVDEVANLRIHGTTGERPREHFERLERSHLAAYTCPLPLLPVQTETRRCDKTGLIAWKANKYSVPMAWQQARVGVQQHGGELRISDLDSGQLIARHPICPDKGRIIKNTHHYRDHARRVTEMEQEIVSLIGESNGMTLCRQLKASSPRIYKDQLSATRRLLRQHGPVEQALIESLVHRPGMTATRLEAYLQAAAAAARRERKAEPVTAGAQQLDLSAYARVGRSSGQEVTHGTT